MKTFALLLCLSLVGCATEAKTIQVTGESINAAGETFVALSPAMNAAFNSKAITAAQYDGWRVFGAKFQQAYPLAVDLWKIAEQNQDKKLEDQAAGVVAGFIVDLAGFSALLGVK